MSSLLRRKMKMPVTTFNSETATDVMGRINPDLTSRFATIIAFLAQSPEAALKARSSIVHGSREHIEWLAHKFVDARTPRAPSPPATVPDEVVSVILEKYFDVPEGQLSSIKETHALSMAAENIVGDLLERYLANTLEAYGWIWCSGSITRSIDFLKSPRTENDPWHCLQVKNRDNSENSSSAAIRNGTDIKKWFRTFSRRSETNWNQFPDETTREILSEEKFKIFVGNYLTTIKGSR